MARSMEDDYWFKCLGCKRVHKVPQVFKKQELECPICKASLAVRLYKNGRVTLRRTDI